MTGSGPHSPSGVGAPPVAPPPGGDPPTSTSTGTPPGSGTRRPHWGSRLFRVLSLAAGLGVTAFVATRVGASPADLLRIPPGAHLLAFGCMAADLLARGTRVSLLARSLGVPLRFWTSVRAQLAGDGAGAVTPSKVGADPAKLWILGADGASLGSRGALLLGEMAAEALVLLAAGLVLAVTAPVSRAVPLAVVTYAAVVMFLGFLAIRISASASQDPPGWWTRLRLSPARWNAFRAQGASFIEHAGALRRISVGHALWVALATVVHMAGRVLVLAGLVAGWAEAAPTSWAALVLWPFGLLYLGSLLPPPGGGGALEVGFAAALGGALPAVALPAALLWWRIYTFYLPAVLGGVVLMLGRDRSAGGEG